MTFSKRCRGLERGTLTAIGSVLMFFGFVGRSVLQSLSPGQEDGVLAVSAVVLQGISCGALPIFSFLLCGAFEKGRVTKKFFLRLLLAAAASEAFYDICFFRKVFYFNEQNPLMAPCITVVMLYFLRRYDGRGIKYVFLKIAIVLSAVLWAMMLSVCWGSVFVAVTGIFHIFRRREGVKLYAVAVVLSLWGAITLVYSMAPVFVILLHFSGDDKDTQHSKEVSA